MGYKKVCFSCKKAFSIYPNTLFNIEPKLICPQCGDDMILFSHRFRPPGKNDEKKWRLIEYLKDNGFLFQHIYKNAGAGIYIQVAYPDTIEEAKIFVKTYKDQANPKYKLF